MARLERNLLNLVRRLLASEDARRHRRRQEVAGHQQQDGLARGRELLLQRGHSREPAGFAAGTAAGFALT